MTNQFIQEMIPFDEYTQPPDSSPSVRPARKNRTLNVMRSVKAAMNEDIRNSGRSREQIMDRMNALALDYGVGLVKGNGKQLTMEAFEKWLNENDPTRPMPLKALPIFCAATGQCSVINAIAAPLGLRVIDGRKMDLLTWAEAKAANKINNRVIRQVESRIFR